MAFSPDGRILASASDGSGAGEGPAIGNIQLWDVTDPAGPTALGPAITAFGEVSSVAFSPDGRILASASDGTYHGPGAGIIQLWDVTDPARPAAARPDPAPTRKGSTRWRSAPEGTSWPAATCPA